TSLSIDLVEPEPAVLAAARFVGSARSPLDSGRVGRTFTGLPEALGEARAKGRRYDLILFCAQAERGELALARSALADGGLLVSVLPQGGPGEGGSLPQLAAALAVLPHLLFLQPDLETFVLVGSVSPLVLSPREVVRTLASDKLASSALEAGITSFADVAAEILGNEALVRELVSRPSGPGA